MLQLLEQNLENIEKAKANLKEAKSLYLAQHAIYTQEYDKQIKMLNDKIKHYENILEEFQKEYEWGGI